MAKVIKYKILQGEDIQFLIPVTISYSESSEAIAKREAYGGRYEIVDIPGEAGRLTVEERLSILEKQISVPGYIAGTWYYRGDRVTFNGGVYTCIAPDGVACVWSPTEYPLYWKLESV